MAISSHTSIESLMRSQDPVVRFAILNRPVFHALESLLNSSEPKVAQYRRRSLRRALTTVQLLGGIGQVKVLLELAKENGLKFDYLGPNEDGLGGDIGIYEPEGFVVAIRVEAKPYDQVKIPQGHDVNLEVSWSTRSS